MADPKEIKTIVMVRNHHIKDIAGIQSENWCPKSGDFIIASLQDLAAGGIICEACGQWAVVSMFNLRDD